MSFCFTVVCLWRGKANAIEAAVSSVLAEGYRTQDIQGAATDQLVGTLEMGDLVLARL